MDYELVFESCKEKTLSGRYITLGQIGPLLDRFDKDGKMAVAGKSVNGKPIYRCEAGSGKTRILMWSQMHGNESTTTKALFDFFNFLESDSAEAKAFLSYFTFCFLPMLNPDGAELYTRANAAGIDLNRDAQDLSQPESIALRETYLDFKPDYCYNLHDQRTIFGVADTGKPATVSFLAPSYNPSCEYNATRLEAVRVINAMNRTLQQYIPGQVGRFDDAFNLNCVGDTFQHLGTPTILFEAGHFSGDYQRESTRKYLFFALLSGLSAIYENVIVGNEIEDYMNIPQNNPCFFDFVYKNIKINYDSSEIITNFAAQFREELINNKIFFNAFVVKIGDLEGFYGHIVFDAQGEKYTDENDNIPKLDQKADFNLGKSVKIVNGSVRN